MPELAVVRHEPRLTRASVDAGALLLRERRSSGDELGVRDADGEGLRVAQQEVGARSAACVAPQEPRRSGNALLGMVLLRHHACESMAIDRVDEVEARSPTYSVFAAGPLHISCDHDQVSMVFESHEMSALQLPPARCSSVTIAQEEPQLRGSHDDHGADDEEGDPPRNVEVLHDAFHGLAQPVARHASQSGGAGEGCRRKSVPCVRSLPAHDVAVALVECRDEAAVRRGGGEHKTAIDDPIPP